jgi:hypothetical protein
MRMRSSQCPFAPAFLWTWMENSQGKTENTCPKGNWLRAFSGNIRSNPVQRSLSQTRVVYKEKPRSHRHNASVAHFTNMNKSRLIRLDSIGGGAGTRTRVHRKAERSVRTLTRPFRPEAELPTPGPWFLPYYGGSAFPAITNT